MLGYMERSYDDLGPYKSRVYNLNSTIMKDPYMVLESERAYELLAGYGYCWVHTVPRCCYPVLDPTFPPPKVDRYSVRIYGKVIL